MTTKMVEVVMLRSGLDTVMARAEAALQLANRVSGRYLMRQITASNTVPEN